MKSLPLVQKVAVAVLGTFLNLSAGQAIAEDNSIVGKVWSQVVTFSAPERYLPAFEDQQGTYYILELVPKGQTVQKWAEMITLTGSRGISGKAGAFAENLKSLYGQGCPETFVSVDLPPPRVGGARAVAAAYVGCGDLGGYSEAMVFVAIDGDKDVYTLQWAVRGKAFDGPPEYDAAKWKARLHQFRSATFSN
jgi:hypothetical protein